MLRCSDEHNLRSPPLRPNYHANMPEYFLVQWLLICLRLLLYVCIRMKALFCTPLFSSGRGSFLALSAAGHAGGPRVLTAPVWAPAGLRGACSGRSKSRELESNHGIAFRRARASQAHGNAQYIYLVYFLVDTSLCCCF